MEETLKAFGQLKIVKLDGLTGITTTQIVPNIVTTVGKNYIAGRMLQVGTHAPMTCMGIGTAGAANAPAVGNDRLFTEVLSTAYVGGIRPVFEVSANPSLPGTASANVLTYTTIFLPVATASTNAITEAGIFNNTTVPGAGGISGIMLARTTFGTVTKTHLDTLTITWTVTIA